MSQSFDLPPPPQPPPHSLQSTDQFQPPRILEYGPLQGCAGDNFHISISSTTNIDPNLLKVAFDSCITTCHFTVDTVTQIITFHSIVPSCDSSRVPIYLLLEQSDQILDSWLVGYFTFYSRKRLSIDQNDPIENTNDSKRSRQTDQYAISSNYPANYYGLSPHAPYVGLPPTQPSPRQREYFEETAILGYPSSSYQPSFNDGDYISSPTTHPQQDPYIMPLMDTILTTPPSSSPSTAPSIQMKPSPLPPLQTNTSPNITATPNYPPISSSSNQPQPQSQPQQQSAMLTLNPFANLLNKANLNIQGDLESMIKDWTPEEWENQRRLVQFWRRQQGNEVTCNFKAFQLPIEKSKQPDMSKLIIVSCIYWKEKNDYFITSVDCIYLLEHLIGVKFTVEEKNRIRRNLEGYKPLTVSKSKPESADFFKLIMGFPNPKPRNIEKDVKVFPWAILGVALKKIISKYTASYSSTASVNYDILTSTDSNNNNNNNNNNNQPPNTSPTTL
ncbi:hypothetical protein INT47_000397 [Mucor saturninus]|uniref:DUF7082 domain-containing protein n=1 Tax=Mucor saturninus TaxID=64648 RepID=A0A8H7QV62_9FUNG|nr:hypothetical protein INT47_000397 [Mucor saturninus]